MNTLKINGNSYNIKEKIKIGEGKNSYVYKCLCDNNLNYIIKEPKDIIFKSKINKEYSYSFYDDYIIGLGNCNNKTVLVMKEIKGKSLENIFNYIKENNIEKGFDYYYDIFYQINLLINNLHKYFIFHNDIILKNIYIDNDNINIIDYSESICYYNKNFITSFYYNNSFDNSKFIDDYNFININNKLGKMYLNTLKIIDKFNICMMIFKNYYNVNTHEGKVDKLNNICQVLENYFSISNKNLIQFILNNNLLTRINIPCFMLVLYKNKLLNINIVNHIKKLLIVINHYKDLNIDFIHSINNLYDNQPLRNINISHKELLLLFIIYYSLLIYVKNNNIFIPKCFIPYYSYLNFLENLFYKKIKITKNIIHNDNEIFYDITINSDISLIKLINDFGNIK